jgi:hypothetical protein
MDAIDDDCGDHYYACQYYVLGDCGYFAWYCGLPSCDERIERALLLVEGSAAAMLVHGMMMIDD